MKFTYNGICDCPSIKAFKMAAEAMDWSDCDVEVFDVVVDGRDCHRVKSNPKEAAQTFLIVHDHFMEKAVHN